MKRRQFCVSLAAATLSGVRTAEAADAVRVTEQVWNDAARNRAVPVRIYEPVGAQATHGSGPGTMAATQGTMAATQGTMVATPGTMTAAQGSLPVLLFSHGLGGSRAGGEQWARLWAANGFLCVHMQHHGSDDLLWKGKNPLSGFAALRRAMNLENGLLRAQDVVFVLDQIGRRNQAGDAIFRRANLERIGMSGHSFGARTTVAAIAALDDKRIRAAIAFSPAPEASEARNRERFATITIPFMNLTGTADHLPLVDDVSAADRRLPYQFMHGPDKYLLVLVNADHMVFNGQPAERKWTIQNLVVHAPLIERATLDFWNAYLKGDASALAELTQGGFKAAVGANGEWFAK